MKLRADVPFGGSESLVWEGLEGTFGRKNTCGCTFWGVWKPGLGRPGTFQIRHFEGLSKSVPPAYKITCGNQFFGESWPPPYVVPARNQEEGLEGTKRRENTCGCTFCFFFWSGWVGPGRWARWPPTHPPPTHLPTHGKTWREQKDVKTRADVPF